MNTNEMRKRLNAIFKGLWDNTKGITGSWDASNYHYQYTYIRRGPLLLRGEAEFSDMWVLVPGDCKVIPIWRDYYRDCNTFPIIKGELIKVSLQDEGPWLEYLAKEIPLMEAELKESCDKREAAEQKAKEERAAKRRAELDTAKAVFSQLIIIRKDEEA